LGERPYVCTFCGKDFNQSQVLKDHLLLHTGIKAFRVSVEWLLQKVFYKSCPKETPRDSCPVLYASHYLPPKGVFASFYSKL
jgi:hypothetical protein